jgi:hypothetical protein
MTMEITNRPACRGWNAAYDPKTGVTVHRHLAMRYPGAHANGASRRRGASIGACGGAGAENCHVAHVDPARSTRQALEAQQAAPLTFAELQRRKGLPRPAT